MGARGPLPLPENVRELRGNAGKQPPASSPKARPGIPSRPEFLSAEAKREWRRVVGELDEMGILSTVDRAILAMYCDAWAKFVEARRLLEPTEFEDGRQQTVLVIVGHRGAQSKNPAWQIYRDAATTCAALAAQLGLTPNARLRMPAAPEEDDAADLFE